MPDSANDPSAAVVVHPPRLLVLEQGAMRVHRNGEAVKRDELWQGEARDPYVADAPLVPVYVRVTEPNPLVAELLCGLIADLAGWWGRSWWGTRFTVDLSMDLAVTLRRGLGQRLRQSFAPTRHPPWMPRNA